MKKLLIVVLSFATFACFAADKPVEKKATKEEVMIKIKALKLLADMGNKEAENKIKILKLLLLKILIIN